MLAAGGAQSSARGPARRRQDRGWRCAGDLGDSGCVRTKDGRVQCWGLRVEPGSYDTGDTSFRPLAGQTRVDDLDLNDSTLCVRSDGQPRCFVRGETSQPVLQAPTSAGVLDGDLALGGFTSCVSTEAETSCRDGVKLVGASSVVVSDHHACALRDEGDVWCWGANESGQIAGDDVPRCGLPVSASSGPAIDVAVGAHFTCVAERGSGVRCRGAGFGPTWTFVPASEGAARLVAGRAHACLFDDEGRVRCWGAGSLGQLGADTTNSATNAVAVGGIDAPVVQLAAAGDHTCALTQRGQVWCWGLTMGAQRHYGTPTGMTRAVAVPGGYEAVEIAVGTEHGCLRGRSGKIACWGHNDKRQVGPSLPVGRRVEHSVVDRDDCMRVDENVVAERPVEVVW